MKKSIFVILVLLFPIIVEAKCTNSEIARLKSLASQISVTYDYVEKDGAIFSVTIHNINKDLKISSNKSSEKRFLNNDFYDLTINNISFPGTYSFDILVNKSECMDKNIGKKYYTIPYYNKYYNDPLCKSNKNKALCQKWVNTNYLSYDEFKNNLLNTNQQNQVENKKESSYNQIMDFFGKYYYVFLIGIIVISITIIIFINRKNRYNFDI